MVHRHTLVDQREKAGNGLPFPHGMQAKGHFAIGFGKVFRHFQEIEPITDIHHHILRPIRTNSHDLLRDGFRQSGARQHLAKAVFDQRTVGKDEGDINTQLIGSGLGRWQVLASRQGKGKSLLPQSLQHTQGERVEPPAPREDGAVNIKNKQFVVLQFHIFRFHCLNGFLFRGSIIPSRLKWELQEPTLINREILHLTNITVKRFRSTCNRI